MIEVAKTYPLRQIVDEIQIPFKVRKPNFSSNFYCRVDRIENGIAYCTGFQNGREYTAKKYQYTLTTEVVFLGGEPKMQHIIPTVKPQAIETKTNIPPVKPSISTSVVPPSVPEVQPPKPVIADSPAIDKEPTPKIDTVHPIGAQQNPKPVQRTPSIKDSGFASASVMNAVFYDFVQDNPSNAKWIRILCVNYLYLIRRKIRILFENDDFDIEDVAAFSSHFPAYTGNSFSEDDLSYISLLLMDLFDLSLNGKASGKLDLGEDILTFIRVHRCSVKLKSSEYIPIVDRGGELTVFGVFAFINTLLDSNERNALAFDLLNESSAQSHYYLEHLFMKSLPANAIVQGRELEEQEKDRSILSLYLHRQLTLFFFSPVYPDGDTLIRDYIESAYCIGEKAGNSIYEIVEAIKEKYPKLAPTQKLFERICDIAINRKYYNLIKWQKWGDKSSFLKNAERFCKKLIFISEKLITDLDEMILYDCVGKIELHAINREQLKELRDQFQSDTIPVDKLVFCICHISNALQDVLHDDELLGSRYKWFFTFTQSEEDIIPDPKEGYNFIGWESKPINDSPIATFRLLTDVCEEIRKSSLKAEPEMKPEFSLDSNEEDGIPEAYDEEQDDEYDDDLAQRFYRSLESSEKSTTPCRVVLYTHKFEKSLQGLEPDVATKVELIKKKFAFLPDKELKEYLSSQNSKHLQGRKSTDIPFYKFRLTRSARIFFCYGCDLQIREKTYPKGTIVLSEVVAVHDEQDKAGSAGINQVFRFDDFCKRDSGMQVDDRTLLYEANTMLPLLSDEQDKCTRIKLPCEIMGSAGSGKSSIAVEMYRRKLAEQPDLRILYVANNPALVKHIRENLLHAGVVNPQCITYGELSMGNRFHSIDFVQRDTLDNYINSLRTNRNKYAKIDKEIFLMCFDSGIKGNAQLAGTGRRLIPKEVFLKETASKERLSTEIAEAIYELATKYDDYLQKQKIWDSNDLARSLIHKASQPEFRKYDVILADEIQDMTGLQVQGLLLCCKNFNICFLGDRNQVIVPSTFNFGDLEKGFYGKLPDTSTVQRVLKKTYRCGKQLIDYLNRLNVLRREKIGAGSQEDDAFEESMRGDADCSMIAVLVTDPKVCQDFIQRAKETAQCSIIVDNSISKGELAAGDTTPNIITVEDAKGLEYNIVVLYNFVRDNHLRFTEIFDDANSSKRSTLHRIVFNKYYVSCTRAIDRIVICEGTGCADEFKDTLFEGIDEKNDLDELYSYLNPSTEAWLTEAIRLYDLGRYHQAADYLKKYISLNPERVRKEYEKYCVLCDCQIMLQTSKDIDDRRHCAEMLEIYGDDASARNVYEQYLDDHYNVFRIDLKTGNPEHYTQNPEVIPQVLSGASISDEDANTITSSQFIHQLLQHTISITDTILEDLQYGE